MPHTKYAFCRDQPEVIDSYLAEEYSRGRVLGPLSQEPFLKQIRCDPNGNIRKVASNSGHVLPQGQIGE